MTRLVVNPGSPDAWEIQLKPGINLIGRGFSNDFKLGDPSVSGSHCQIEVTGQGVTIKDLGSTNGTYIDRAKIQEAMLQSGQTVHLGNVVLVFYADTPAAASAHAPVVARSSAAAVAHAPAAAARPGAGSGAPAAPIVARVVRPTAPAVAASARPVAAGGGTAVAVAPESIPAPSRTAVLPRSAIPAPTLAVTAHSEPAANASALTVPSPAALEAGPHPCKSHPKTQARFYCQRCQDYFCELCVTSRNVGGVAQKFCRHCGAECVAVRAPVTFRPAGEKSFFARLPGAFVYPLRGSGILMLAAGTLIFALLNWLKGEARFGIIPNVLSPWRLVFQVVALGYLFAYLQSIIHSTATEEPELPPLPTAADFWQDILLPAMQLIGLTLFCFAPAIALSWYVVSTESSSLGPVLIATFVLGGLYLPMAFLTVAMLDSVLAANPLQVVPSILKVPLEYLVALIVLAAVFALRAAGDWAILQIFPRGLITHNMATLAGYFGAQALWGLISMYLFVVGFHVLGLVYVSKKDKLGWLGH